MSLDGNSSEEEGAIGTRGSSKVMSETVQFNEDGATDEKEIMRIMGFSGFDTTKVIFVTHQICDTPIFAHCVLGPTSCR